jgi:hypothetical protein
MDFGATTGRYIVYKEDCMTPSHQTNEERKLSFSNELINARVVRNVRDYIVDGAIVVNLSPKPIETGGEVLGIIPPWRSTILRGGKIVDAELAAVISVPSAINLGGLPLLDWQWYGDLNKNFPRNLPLYISSQDSVGTVKTDPHVLTNQASVETDIHEFEVKLNLWWAPPETDCSIHIEHPFLELHTQIHGVGRMQKFHERNSETVYEDIYMAPGLTHEPLARMTGEFSWQYPWHRYYADTAAIWMAIEFHPTRR